MLIIMEYTFIILIVIVSFIILCLGMKCYCDRNSSYWFRVTRRIRPHEEITAEETRDPELV